MGITAAPFLNAKSASPEEGMEKSYREILALLTLSGIPKKPAVYSGSRCFLPGEETPVSSPAADFLVAEAKRHTPKAPLYIVAIGAITNVASAFLMAPEEMRENTVVVWLGGHGTHYPHTREFNMIQDVAAARVVMKSGVPLVQLPCMGVVSAFTTTEGELRRWLWGKNPLADYLVENTVREAESYAKGKAWSRCIWDVTAVAYLLNEGDRFLASDVRPLRLPTYEGVYGPEEASYIRYVWEVRRDALFTDLFGTLGDDYKNA